MVLTHSHKTEMKNYRYILLFTISALLVGGCSDELSTFNSGENDNKIQLKINVPEAAIVKTREVATEEEMSLQAGKNVYAYFFNEENKLIGSEKLSGVTDGSTVTIRMTPDMQSAESLKIVVVGNLEEGGIAGLTEKSSVYTDLLQKSLALEENSQPGSPFVMSGVAQGTGLSYTVDLERTAAKISVQLSGAKDFRLEGYSVYNAPSEGFYTAGAVSKDTSIESDKDDFIFKTGNSVYNISTGVEGVYSNYIYPVKTVGGTNYQLGESISEAYIVLKGRYGNDTESSFYRVDLKASSTGDDYLDIEPNHWYQIEIKEVKRRGYSSAGQAVLRSMNDEMAIEAVIHDHAANVMSMITDGVRELGATYEVIWKETEGSNVNTFTIKWYSPNNSEQSEKPIVTILSGEDWLEIDGEPTEVGAIDETNGNQAEKDNDGKDVADNPGNRLNYTLSSAVAVPVYDMEAVIRVEWMGMKRDVTIRRNVSFDPLTICRAQADFNDGTSITDYWSFLLGDGERQGDTPKLWGVDKNAMADGKIRDEGFHFAMPYGNDHGTKYEYSLWFDETLFPDISDIYVDKIGDSYLVDHIQVMTYDDGNNNIVQEKNKVVLLYDVDQSESTKFTYATGSLKFWITFKPEGSATEETTQVTFDTYHTGFFHKDKDGDYYYYEVVPMGNKYWLDRNLGAKSNRMYVDNGAALSHGGNPDAAGRFYTIAMPGSEYEDCNIYNSLSIPGYHLPNRAEWDAVRLSADFTSENITEDNISYTATFYQTPVSKIGRVYFPKARYYNSANSYKTMYENKANMGDAGSGYYWTTTSAQGLEKEQIGQWLKVLNLSGSSNTYINGSINDSKMNVRLAAGRNIETDEVYAINFNVKGATHVYLYSTDIYGNKSGIFSFPGKAIGNQSSVDNLYKDNTSDYIHFSYNSPISPADLKVFFTYVEDSGKITILSVNNATNLKDAEGWDVMVGWNYFFNEDKTQLDLTAAEGAPKTFIKGDKVTIIWPSTMEIKEEQIECNYIYIWPESKVNIGGWPGAEAEKSGSGYSYEVEIESRCDYFNVILNDNNGHQTGDIIISVENVEETSEHNYKYEIK